MTNHFLILDAGVDRTAGKADQVDIAKLFGETL